MRRTHVASAFLTLAVSLSASVTACSSAPTDEAGATSADETTSQESVTFLAGLQWWRGERATRQAAFDGYLAANADDYKSFKNTPLGTSGIPMIMIRLFPEIFPELWGAPDTNFAAVGFAKDDLEPGRVLPLGLGYIGSSPAIPTPAGPVNVNVVNLTCAGCHTGRVQAADGSQKSILGAPSTTFRNFRGMVYATVTSPKYTADTFRAALAAHPLGWVYGDPAMGQQEALERAIFMAPGSAEQFLAKLQAGSIGGAQRWAQTLGAYTYNTPNAPNPSASTPGYLDAIGAGIAIVVDPAVVTGDALKAALPPLPAMIDIMSVWNQKSRPFAQWDGSITTKLHRNLAAEFGVIGDPTKLNMDNANRTTRLTENMPSPPYPFDLPVASVAIGKVLYGKYCASCHEGSKSTIFPAATVGTDPNRAVIWTPYNTAALRGALRIGCTDPVTCFQADGSPVPDDHLVRSTGGYLAPPLDGIWARAPYLHNGSVPTLRALLTKNRPATFYRGNAAYDQLDGGFVSNAVVTPGAAIFDTTKSGNSNKGHDSRAFLGNLDWSRDCIATDSLIAYLKTL